MGLGVLVKFLGVGVVVVLVCEYLCALLRSVLVWLGSAHPGRVLRDCTKNFFYPLIYRVFIKVITVCNRDQVIMRTVVDGRLKLSDCASRKQICGKTDVGISCDSDVIKMLNYEEDNIKNKSVIKAQDLSKLRNKLATAKTHDKTGHGFNESLTISVTRVSVNQLPDMTRACMKNSFSCYRSIIPWVTKVNRDMGFILNDILPECGPVSSMELGSMLAQLICDFRISNMRLPILVNTVVDGKVYLHFDAMKLEAINISVCKLLAFNGFVGASLDPTAMIKAAASVGAPTIAANEASAIFREQLSSLLKVETVLTAEDQDLINRERCHVRYLQKYNITNDHPLMAAYREIIRHDFDIMFNASNTKLRTLVLGASSREVRLFNHNKNVFFQIALQEGKDMNRFVTNCLVELKQAKAKKLSKKKATGKEQLLRRAEDAVISVEFMIDEWRNSRKIPERFMLWDDSFELFKGRLGLYNFDVIIFQDVGYNFSESEWLNIFESTGASTGYGYMCLPWELLEPKLLSTHGYVFRVDGDKSKLAYFGYSNGYVHKTSTWSTLMFKPVLVGKSFSIVVEFVARIGPMTCVRMVKTVINELHVRNLEVPEYLRTVQILDIVESFNLRKQRLDLNNLVYFPVRASEFHDVVNYALDVAKEALNFNTILLYIRRRCSGISLVTRDVAKSWTAPKHKLPAFALVVYLYTNHMSNDFIKLQDKQHMVLPSKFVTFIRRLFVDSDLVEMFRSYYEYFLQRDLFHILVKDVDHSFWQERWAKGSTNKLKVFSDPNPEDYLVYSDEECEEEVGCSMCLTLKSVCGEQLFTCDRDVEEFHQHDFTLSNDELVRLKSLLADTAKDHPGIKHVKEAALAKVPPSVFSHKAHIYYICGPPGTGKSYIIRALANRDDLVITPFTRLKQDYTNFIHPITKQKSSLRCYTQHAAFTALNHPRIFVDEYTAMPYEFLSVIVYNCAAEEVFFVGDHRQVSLINEVEGLSIISKIDLTKVRAHELVRNYRNPKDAVFVLNTIYLYNMVNMKDFNGFKYDYTENYNLYDEHTPLFFRYSTAERFGIDVDTCQKVTVRSNQGATYCKVKLIVTDNDKDIFNIPSMAIVALSRHTDECVILHENTSISNVFVQMIMSGHQKPRVANLPKLSPVCTATKIDQFANISKETTSEDANRQDQSPNAQKGSVKSKNKHKKAKKAGEGTIKIKKMQKYKIKNATIMKYYDIVLNSMTITYSICMLKFAWSCTYAIMIFIRDFNHWTIINSVCMVYKYVKSALFNLLLEESKETEEEDLSEDKLHAEFNPDVDLGRESTSHNDVFEPQDAFEARLLSSRHTRLQDEPTVGYQQYSQGVGQFADGFEGQQPVHERATNGNEFGVPDTSNINEDENARKDTDHNENINLEETTDVEQEVPTTTTEIPANLDDLPQDISSDFPFPGDVDKLPEQNICMLQSLSVLTGNNTEDTWKSMLIAVGKEKAVELYNEPWSTDEMQAFCCLNDFTVTVIMDGRDDIGCVYGTGQNHVGTIDYISGGVGHFYVKEQNIIRNISIKLITDEGDENISKRKLDKFYITLDTLKQMADSGNTPYNLFIYEMILNYMREDSLSEMIGGESDMLSAIGICDAIVVKGKLPTRFDFLKCRGVERRVLDMVASGFSEPLLVIHLSSLTMTYVITERFDYLRNASAYKKLSKFLELEDISVATFSRFIINRITPRDLKHLSPNDVKSRLEKMLLTHCKKFDVKKTLSGGTIPQVNPFTRFPAVKAKEVAYIPLKNVDEDFKTMARLFVDPIKLNAILVEDKDREDNEYVPLENTSYDSFRMLFEDLATIDEHNFELANQEALGYLDKEFGNGLFNLTAFDNMNQKFKLLKQTESAWSLLNVAPGVTYFKAHLTQSLFCLQMRYLTKAFVCAQSVQSIDKAREIAELFFYEHMELNFDIFNEQDLYQTVLESEKAMEEKHYDKQTDFEPSGDTTVRFAMKDIFKPFKTTIDLFKPGQGISAWSKNLQTIFQTSFRIINKHFINCLSPHVVFDNGMDEYNMMNRVNSLLKLLPDIAINGVIDATACDSGQNKFTQMIERVILEKLGIDDYFLDWYYSHREEYVLKGYNVTAIINDIKTSGEPATLLNNTILMACLMNYLIRGDGPSVLVIKGDDGLKRQLNLRCNESVLPILRNYLKMDFKIDINVPITFCGYFLSGPNLVPDIVRKCFKIAGHRFKDYSHFAEYQQSLRDWVLTVNKMEVAYVCDITATSYKLNYEFVANLFESIVSLTHINERQFKATFKYKRFNWVEDHEHAVPWKDKLPWYKGFT